MSETPLLEVKNLSLAFHDYDQGNGWRLDRVGFRVYPHQTVGVVGESGSGKSVTAMSILRLLPLHHFSQFSGQVLFGGRDLIHLPEKELRKIRGREIGMIFQEPMTSLNPTHTILKQVSENIRSPNGEPTTIRSQKHIEKTIEILRQVGIAYPENFLNRFPHELSGGERQRVMIAMALVNRPRLLIADEPTTALDATVQKKIIDLLQELKQAFNLSLLFVTHDLTLVRKISDTIVVMKDGKVVEQGETNAVINNPQSAYTRALFDNIPNPLPQREYSGNPILKVENLHVTYPVKSPFLKRVIRENLGVKEISFSLMAGKTLGVIGESGSGKTTLLMAILRLIPSRGEILYRDRDINTLYPRELKKLRKNIQVVFQDSYSSLNPRLTVEQIIGEGVEIHFPNLSDEEKAVRVEEVMIEVELSPQDRKRYPHEFSGGQRQRINLARALVLQPDLVLLDEPTSSLDVTLQKQVIEFLLHLQEKRGLSYIFISHDLRVIQAISDWVIVMEKGMIVESGFKEDIFNNSQHPYTQNLIAAYY